jgi:hypothetical protein
MTADARENQQAAAAVAAGEAAETKHLADSVAQHGISGSAEAVEPAATSDDVAVPWFGSDNHPGPGPSPQADGRPNDVAVVDVTQPHDL